MEDLVNFRKRYPSFQFLNCLSRRPKIMGNNLSSWIRIMMGSLIFRILNNIYFSWKTLMILKRSICFSILYVSRKEDISAILSIQHVYLVLVLTNEIQKTCSKATYYHKMTKLTKDLHIVQIFRFPKMSSKSTFSMSAFFLSCSQSQTKIMTVT